MFATDVVIVAGARTPMSRYTGAFSDVSAIELGAHASRAAMQRANVDAAEFDHAIFGNVMQTSSDALYGARHVALRSGLRTETAAVTVNRLCGSGIEAIAQAAQRLLLGESQLVLAPPLLRQRQRDRAISLCSQTNLTAQPKPTRKTGSRP